MRIAVFSDLHGNAAALKAVLSALEAHAPDHAYVLGDLAGRGPRPRKIIDLVAEHGFARTRGRWDGWLAGDTGGSDRPERALRSAERRLRRRDLAFLAAAPDTLRARLEDKNVFFSHGNDISFAPLVSRWTPSEELARFFERREADVIVLGASEPPFLRSVGERLLVNTGSAGYPVTGDPRATFVLIELTAGRPASAEIVRVPYALQKTTRRVKKAVRRGRLEPDLAAEYQLALLGPKEGPDPELHPRLMGSDLTVALLAHRVARVYAAAASPWPEDDVEHVHALRVATRRLREALALATPLLPSVRKLDRRAQRFGRALGARRTLDVFLELVRTRDGAEGLSGFLNFLEARRRDTTTRIHAAYPREKLIAHGLALLSRSMEGSPGRTLDEVAASHLEHRADLVDQRLPAIDLEEASHAHHQLRIALKHLRYAFEILTPAYPEAIDPATTIAPLKALQDTLGALNDHTELVALTEERRAEGVLDEEALALARFAGALEVERRALFEKTKVDVTHEVPRLLVEAHAIVARLRRSTSS